MKRIATLYFVVFGVIYAGLLVHRSAQPLFGPYSFTYLAVLAILSLGFFVPLAARYILEKHGVRSLIISLQSAALLVLLAYAASSTYNDLSETHPFDPYLQEPPAQLVLTEKSPRTFRVLTLGGSTTLDGDLPEQDRYPRRLQDLLQQQSAGKRIEVFNAGMDWFTTKHSLINYVTNLRDWRPDVVIVMHGINDLYRSFSDPDLAMGPYDRSWSHYYGPSINGARRPSFEQHLLGRGSPYWLADLRSFAYTERDVPLERYVSLPDFKRNLGYLVHDLKGDGVAVVLMTEPFLYKDVMTSEERGVLWFGASLCKERRGFLRYDYPSPSSLGRAMAAFNAVTKELGAAERVTVIDLESKIAKTLDNFADDVHYRAAGAHLVADVVAGEIQHAGLLQR